MGERSTFTGEWAARFWKQLATRLNDDPEFVLAARFWNGEVRLGLCDASDGPEELSVEARGEATVCLSDGKISESRLAPTGAAERPMAAGDVSIRGSEAGWGAMLAPVPAPFHHDVMAASVHEGFQVSGDSETFYAYYPAIRRMIDVIRSCTAED
jgi:hypothetical protein